MPTQIRKPPTLPAASGSKSEEAWKTSIYELAGIVQIPLAGAAAKQQIAFGNDPNFISPFALDAFAIEQHKEPIADAIIDLAANFPVLAAVLDKISQSTPFAALATSVITLGIQIAENHGALPEPMRTAIPGLTRREEMAQQVHAETQRFINMTQKPKNNNGASRTAEPRVPPTSPAA